MRFLAHISHFLALNAHPTLLSFPARQFLLSFARKKEQQMFITQATEILDACPSAKLDTRAAEKLVRSIEEEEEGMLEPILGHALMDSLEEDYNRLLEKVESISASRFDARQSTLTDREKLTVRLLRVIQGALVYRMLANKIYSLSTSLNLGGGANRASAGDYEPADDKHLQELRKEYYMNSRRACDNILVMLERDAKKPDGERLWTDMWRESDGYYLKEDLLFPTQRSIRPFIPCEQPTAFISLCPDIRYCQNTYIAPRMDTEILDALTDVTATLTTEQKRLKKYLCVALAYYVLAKRGNREVKNDMFQTADSAMGTALDYLLKHFEKEDGKPSDNTKCPCAQDDACREYETFSTLIPGLNRW